MRLGIQDFELLLELHICGNSDSNHLEGIVHSKNERIVAEGQHPWTLFLRFSSG
jgi:hypothetical protein